MKGLLHAVCLCAVALLLPGCIGYRLGPTNGDIAGSRSIQIAPFANKTVEPRLSENVMNSLRRNFQHDGTFTVNTHNSGDIMLTGEILTFERIGLTSLPTDVVTVQDYAVAMTVHVKALERATGKVLLDSKVRGQTTLRAASDVTSAEQQSLSLLTDDFARRTRNLLVDGTW